MAQIGGSWQSRRALLRERKAHEGDAPQEPPWLRKLRDTLTRLSEGPWREAGYVRLDRPDWETGRGKLAAEDGREPRESADEKPR